LLRPRHIPKLAGSEDRDRNRGICALLRAENSDAKRLVAAAARLPLGGAEPPVRRRRSGPLVWVTLLALLLQSFLVETHVHAPAGDADAPSRITRSTASAISAAKPASGEHSLCPLCAEMALSGHYIATTPVILIPPVVAEFWLYPSIAIAGAWLQAAHHWRSRAPPSESRV
jgi:hypothetical protein